MLSTLHGESPEYGTAPRNRKYVEDSVNRMLYNDSILFLIDDQQRGILIANEIQAWYAPITFVQEQLVYVRPEHRGSSVAARLIASLEHHAKSIGAVAIRCGVTTGIHQEKTAEMYRKRGYVDCGILLQKRIGG